MSVVLLLNPIRGFPENLVPVAIAKDRAGLEKYLKSQRDMPWFDRGIASPINQADAHGIRYDIEKEFRLGSPFEWYYHRESADCFRDIGSEPQALEKFLSNYPDHPPLVYVSG